MALRTFKATLEYDGTDFAGFQRQRTARTVQGDFERALEAVVGAKVAIMGAGRTDAGVHASAQVASFRTDTRLDDATLQRALNALLPGDIVLRALETAPDDFHARRSATARLYEYRIIQRVERPAIDRLRGWHVAAPLNLGTMREAAERFVGEHDFAAFTIGPGRPTVRRVSAVAIWRDADSVYVRVAGAAFLHRMVRRMVALLVRVGLGRADPDDVTALLSSGDREQAPAAAPAQALTLVGVVYPDEVPTTTFNPQYHEMVAP
jgi:tRNA pseudouridine38-40 synthase